MISTWDALNISNNYSKYSSAIGMSYDESIQLQTVNNNNDATIVRVNI